MAFFLGGGAKVKKLADMSENQFFSTRGPQKWPKIKIGQIPKDRLENSGNAITWPKMGLQNVSGAK